jgi:exosortase family protein XrtM
MSVLLGPVEKLDAEMGDRSSVRIPWKRLLASVALFIAMNRTFAQYWSESLRHWVIDVATVEPAAWLARQVEGDHRVLADGSHLRAPDGSINVLYGCEGSDVLMLLAAALLVAPIPWRRRLAGLLAGTALVFALNQARVLALFYAFRRHSLWFGQLHGSIAPLVVVLVVALFFLWWMRRSVPVAKAST